MLRRGDSGEVGVPDPRSTLVRKDRFPTEPSRTTSGADRPYNAGMAAIQESEGK